MGYYTYYHLEEQGHLVLESKQFAEDFEKITSYPLDAIDDGSLKWYDHNDHMLILSTLYPSTIFTLWGDGEESDDFWKAVYCNGEFKRVDAELVYPDIDISTIGQIGERHPEYFI